MTDQQKIVEALEALKSQGYQTGLWVMGSLEGERHCYIGIHSRSAFDASGHLCSAVPLHWSGNAQDIIDAFVEAGKGNFGIDWDGQTESPLYVNPASSLARFRPGRPVERHGDYQRITLEIRKDLLAKIDASGKSRREYIEQLVQD
jgi:hypothetical protein